MVEILSSVRIARGAPLLDAGIIPVLQPPVVVGDFESAIFVGNRTLGRCWRLEKDWSLSQGDNSHQAERGEKTQRRVSLHEDSLATSPNKTAAQAPRFFFSKSTRAHVAAPKTNCGAGRIELKAATYRRRPPFLAFFFAFLAGLRAAFFLADFLPAVFLAGLLAAFLGAFFFAFLAAFFLAAGLRPPPPPPAGTGLGAGAAGDDAGSGLPKSGSGVRASSS